MGYALREHLHYCITGARLVFLDLAADRYFCIAPHLDEVFRQLLDKSATNEAERRILEPLVANSVLRHVPGCDGAIVRDPPCASCASLLDERLEKPPLPLVACALTSCFLASRQIKARPLFDIVQQILARKRHLASPAFTASAAKLRAAAAAFDRCTQILAARDKCLPRSLAMVRHLASRGIAADLVFGVTLGPFSAHCWVQVEDWILNDHLEHVQNFTPILAI